MSIIGGKRPYLVQGFPCAHADANRREAESRAGIGWVDTCEQRQGKATTRSMRFQAPMKTQRA